MDIVGRIFVPIEMRKICNVHSGDFVEMSERHYSIKRDASPDKDLLLRQELLKITSIASETATLLIYGDDTFISSVPLNQIQKWDHYIHEIGAHRYDTKYFQKIVICNLSFMVRQFSEKLKFVVYSETALGNQQCEVLESCLRAIGYIDPMFFSRSLF